MEKNKPDLSGLKSQSALYVGMMAMCRLLTFEGTIRSSKTITAIEIFIQRVNDSKDINHLIACKDYDAINNNILESNRLGILYRYPHLFKLKKDKIGGYYLWFRDSRHRTKKILLAGYEKESTWKKVLGGTLGCIFIDEVNIASERFIDECFARQVSATNPFTMWTLNGDDPSHWIYQKYINRCKVLMGSDCPMSIKEEMQDTPKEKGWYYLHWNMRDNPIMTEAKIEEAKALYPVGSFYYNVKILGIRGRSEGTIFAQYIVDKELEKEMDRNRVIFYDIGLDIGNNDIKRGTILTLTAVEKGYTDAYVIESYEAKSTEVNALVNELTHVIGEWYDKYDRFKFNGVWMDSYGAIQLMLETLRREVRKQNMNLQVNPCMKFGDEKGRMARLELIMMLINQRRIHFTDRSRNTLNSLKKLVYNEKDGLPLDENQLEMDYYDSLCYALTPHIRELTRVLKGGN